MWFPPRRTQSVAVLVTYAIATILVAVFACYRICRRIDSDSAHALRRRADDLAWSGQWFAVLQTRQARQHQRNQLCLLLQVPRQSRMTRRQKIQISRPVAMEE